MGGVGYYRKILLDLSKRIRPLTFFLRKGVKYAFTLAMNVIVRQTFTELDAPLSLVFLDWDTGAGGFRPFHVYCDDCIDGFGAGLEQEQPDDSVRPISYISRATPDSERHWAPLDLEADSLVWAIKQVRGNLWGAKFHIISDHDALESIGKVGNHTACVQRWLKFLAAFDYTFECRKGSATGNADFLSRLLEPTTEHDRSGSSSLTPVENSGIVYIQAWGLRTCASPTPCPGLSWLISPTERDVLRAWLYLFGCSRF